MQSKKNEKKLKKSVDKAETAWYYKQALERVGRKTAAESERKSTL